eukprot:364284-Chlamydomonas_euryale.AAC.4
MGRGDGITRDAARGASMTGEHARSNSAPAADSLLQLLPLPLRRASDAPAAAAAGSAAPAAVAGSAVRSSAAAALLCCGDADPWSVAAPPRPTAAVCRAQQRAHVRVSARGCSYARATTAASETRETAAPAAGPGPRCGLCRRRASRAVHHRRLPCPLPQLRTWLATRAAGTSDVGALPDGEGGGARWASTTGEGSRRPTCRGFASCKAAHACGMGSWAEEAGMACSRAAHEGRTWGPLALRQVTTACRRRGCCHLPAHPRPRRHHARATELLAATPQPRRRRHGRLQLHRSPCRCRPR